MKIGNRRKRLYIILMLKILLVLLIITGLLIILSFIA